MKLNQVLVEGPGQQHYGPGPRDEWEHHTEIGDIDDLPLHNPRSTAIKVAAAATGFHFRDAIWAVGELKKRKGFKFDQFVTVFQREVFANKGIDDGVDLLKRFSDIEIDVGEVLEYLDLSIKNNTRYTVKHSMLTLDEADGLNERILAALKSPKHADFFDDILEKYVYKDRHQTFHSCQVLFNVVMVSSHLKFKLDIKKDPVMKLLLSMVKLDDEDHINATFAKDLIAEIKSHVSWPEIAIIEKSLESMLK